MKAKVTQNINNQEGVFKRTSDAIIANEKAVDRLNGYAEQFDRIDGEISALVGAVNERDEAQAKQQAELKAILIACVNMLHTAYAHSNLTEETKSVIEGFFGDAIHYNQKMADMKISLESLVEKFNELKTKVEDAKSNPRTSRSNNLKTYRVGGLSYEKSDERQGCQRFCESPCHNRSDCCGRYSISCLG